MSQENVEVVRKLIDAVNRGDLDAWLGFLSPEVYGSPCPSLGLKTSTAGERRRESGSSSSSKSLISISRSTRSRH